MFYLQPWAGEVVAVVVCEDVDVGVAEDVVVGDKMQQSIGIGRGDRQSMIKVKHFSAAIYGLITIFGQILLIVIYCVIISTSFGYEGKLVQ